MILEALRSLLRVINSYIDQVPATVDTLLQIKSYLTKYSGLEKEYTERYEKYVKSHTDDGKIYIDHSVSGLGSKEPLCVRERRWPLVINSSDGEEWQEQIER